MITTCADLVAFQTCVCTKQRCPGSTGGNTCFADLEAYFIIIIIDGAWPDVHVLHI